MTPLKYVLIAGAIIISFPFILAALFLGFAWVDMRLENSSYAKRVFLEMQYDGVLASNAVNTFFGGSRPWDNCAYGVVSLPSNASTRPPAPSRLPGFRERHIYLDEWQPTPTSHLRSNGKRCLRIGVSRISEGHFSKKCLQQPRRTAVSIRGAADRWSSTRRHLKSRL